MRNQVPESEKGTENQGYSSPASFPGQKKFLVPIVTNINFLPTTPQGAKKIIFTACLSGKLRLEFTSPDIISNSPKPL